MGCLVVLSRFMYGDGVLHQCSFELVASCMLTCTLQFDAFLHRLSTGQFETLVGAGGSKLQKQTWLDDESDGALKLVKNASVALLGTPASFLAADSWISSPTQTIIRTSNNSLLLSVYAECSLSPTSCFINLRGH